MVTQSALSASNKKTENTNRNPDSNEPGFFCFLHRPLERSRSAEYSANRQKSATPDGLTSFRSLCWQGIETGASPLPYKTRHKCPCQNHHINADYQNQNYFNIHVSDFCGTAISRVVPVAINNCLHAIWL